MSLLSRTTLALVLIGLAAVATFAAGRQSSSFNTDRGGLAVHGYDVVAYIVDGVAMRGRADFEYRWQNAVWRFASAAHRDQFAGAPEQFAPQFGGFCAWAVSRGYTADIDPSAWRVVDGKLYLNYSRRVQRMWEQDIAGNIARARDNWPGVLTK